VKNPAAFFVHSNSLSHTQRSTEGAPSNFVKRGDLWRDISVSCLLLASIYKKIKNQFQSR